MNHDGPRLVTNDAQAQILNSLYGVALRKGFKELGKPGQEIALDALVTDLLALVAERNPDFYELDGENLRSAT